MQKSAKDPRSNVTTKTGLLRMVLKETAERCMSIAEALSDTDGRALTPDEKEFCRIAMLPRLSAQLNEIKFTYLVNPEDLARTIEHIHDDIPFYTSF